MIIAFVGGQKGNIGAGNEKSLFIGSTGSPVKTISDFLSVSVRTRLGAGASRSQIVCAAKYQQFFEEDVENEK
jgi:hypothetical protein